MSDAVTLTDDDAALLAVLAALAADNGEDDPLTPEEWLAADETDRIKLRVRVGSILAPMLAAAEAKYREQLQATRDLDDLRMREITALKADRDEGVQVADAAHALNRKLISAKVDAEHACRKWIVAGRNGAGAGEYAEAGRHILHLLNGTVWCDGMLKCDGHQAGTEGWPCVAGKVKTDG